MILTIVSASNLKYTDALGNGIDLMVQFQEFPNPIAYHAVPNDSVPHGIELYNRAKAGEFGAIADYEPN
jgi:hypothetical protein